MDERNKIVTSPTYMLGPSIRPIAVRIQDNMPSGFHIFTSNRMEVLATRLAEVLRHDAGSDPSQPLRPQTVMVQSKGMQRWISMTVARLNGICANTDFPFPNALLEKLYTQIIGPLPEHNPYAPPIMTFRILNALPDLLKRPQFRPLHRYLTDRHRPLKLYQLAHKIADTFDQYVVYRPDLLSAWENGRVSSVKPNTAWQAILWQQLVRETHSPCRSVLQQVLVRRLSEPTPAWVMERLPAGLSVFGISYLPPFHLEVLQALAGRIPVYLFLLNPCRGFWFDILSDHQMIRMRAAPQHRSIPSEHLHLERGNRLLASLGHLGRQFFDRVYQFQANLSDEFFDNQTDSLLGRIQQDILDLADRPQAGQESAIPPARADGTLRIHACHSPMREVEVLHDQLLDLLDNHPDLQPRDILVMAPDIGMYSPYIHAVFGAGEHSRPRLPYTVADQIVSRENDMIEGFIGLLDLVQGRLEASRVIKLLDCDAICQKFGLSEADLPTVEKWIRSAGIRWGWDAADRKRHNLPAFKANSWLNGLDRLVLGYAMAEDNSRLFSGILPYDGIGAGEGPILGRLAEFADAVHDSIGRLSAADFPQGWRKRLKEVLDRLFQADERNTYELQTLHGVIDQLQQVGSVVDQRRPIAFEVIRQHIIDTLGKTTYDTGFMSGGVTFCAMLPMRAIPAAVICLLGMNHDAYPREHHEPGFNLIPEEPRSGDRSKRNDDRYLFLEMLISARKAFYISYVGQNIQDNAAIPPSVLVDEIVEYVNEGFGIAVDQFVIHHPLQGFSPVYFNGQNPRLFSFAIDNEAAAEQLTTTKSELSFFAEPLDSPQDDWRRCDWEALVSFLMHSSRFLLERRLGVFLYEDFQTIEDRENFVLDALARHKINQQILEGSLRGTAKEQIYEALEASGTMPHGTVGKVVYQDMRKEVQTFINTMTALLPVGESARSEQVELDISPYTLSGRIDDLYGHARISWRMARTRPADLLRTFVFHLALLAAAPDGLPDCSILVCRDTVWHFGRIENPGHILKDYLDLYWQGLHAPLPLFNRTSFEFARQVVINQCPRETARAAALKHWRGNGFVAGEWEDDYYHRCFGGQVALGTEFEETALKVYRPLFDACRSESQQ